MRRLDTPRRRVTPADTTNEKPAGRWRVQRVNLKSWDFNRASANALNVGAKPIAYSAYRK
jgi:hypothetical protein